MLLPWGEIIATTFKRGWSRATSAHRIKKGQKKRGSSEAGLQNACHPSLFVQNLLLFLREIILNPQDSLAPLHW